MATTNAVNNTMKITRYLVDDTWVKDSRTQMVSVYLWDAGGGGGSGRRGLTGASGGGAGGGGGHYSAITAPASFFGANEPVVVGIGGTGGAAQTVDTTNGNPGTAGTKSGFGYLLNKAAIGGSLGLGGVNGNAVSTNSTFVNIQGITNQSSVDQGTGALTNGTTAIGVGFDANGSESLSLSSGGGGGAGANSVTERTGGAGGPLMTLDGLTTILAGGAGGVESGTINGSIGNAQPTSGGLIFGGTGGGGGGGQSAGAAAGNGGNGGFPGGGGGGGGGSLNGTDSGAGGDGADGLVIVIEHF